MSCSSYRSIRVDVSFSNVPFCHESRQFALGDAATCALQVTGARGITSRDVKENLLDTRCFKCFIRAWRLARSPSGKLRVVLVKRAGQFALRYFLVRHHSCGRESPEIGRIEIGDSRDEIQEDKGTARATIDLLATEGIKEREGKPIFIIEGSHPDGRAPRKRLVSQRGLRSWREKNTREKQQSRTQTNPRARRRTEKEGVNSVRAFSENTPFGTAGTIHSPSAVRSISISLH